MADIEALRDAASQIGQTLKEASRSKSDILMMASPEADGIASAAILCKTVFSMGGIFTARFSRYMADRDFEKLSTQGHDLLVFMEVADGREEELSRLFKGKAVFMGHHQPAEKAERSLNSWSFGFDGSKEVSGSGLAYLVSQSVLPNPNSAAWLAVLGALGDRQDTGAKRSLIGLNEMFVQDAVGASQLEFQEDLLLFGREVKPLHESVALTSDPYIQGL
ncbi:MAG: DHH family phosphoesterase, partial [Nitrososphaerota archaeon]|nr:DHH family phosphoesterase [Nitrososphaerota archaeon]